MDYDKGIMEDFDNMTEELGTTVEVFTRNYDLTHESQEGTDTENMTGKKEKAFIQELETKHEVVASGQFSVGDVRIIFQHDSIVEEECQVLWKGAYYKVLNLTKTSGMNNDVIMDIKAFGKKLPGR